MNEEKTPPLEKHDQKNHTHRGKECAVVGAHNIVNQSLNDIVCEDQNASIVLINLCDNEKWRFAANSVHPLNYSCLFWGNLHINVNNTILRSMPPQGWGTCLLKDEYNGSLRCKTMWVKINL